MYTRTLLTTLEVVALLVHLLGPAHNALAEQRQGHPGRNKATLTALHGQHQKHLARMTETLRKMADYATDMGGKAKDPHTEAFWIDYAQTADDYAAFYQLLSSGACAKHALPKRFVSRETLAWCTFTAQEAVMVGVLLLSAQGSFNMYFALHLGEYGLPTFVQTPTLTHLRATLARQSDERAEVVKPLRDMPEVGDAIRVFGDKMSAAPPPTTNPDLPSNKIYDLWYCHALSKMADWKGLARLFFEAGVPLGKAYVQEMSHMRTEIYFSQDGPAAATPDFLLGMLYQKTQHIQEEIVWESAKERYGRGKPLGPESSRQEMDDDHNMTIATWRLEAQRKYQKDKCDDLLLLDAEPRTATQKTP